MVRCLLPLDKSEGLAFRFLLRYIKINIVFNFTRVNNLIVKSICVLIIFISSSVLASIDIGVGTSSFTSGRAAPALALGVDIGNWGLLYRSVGVQTTIYSQNSWTLAGIKNIYTEKMGITTAFMGAGLGTCYIMRSYRESPSSVTDSYNETVIGPHLLFKIQLGPAFLSFDTLLGLSTNIIQHMALNFQDVSHISLGIAL